MRSPLLILLATSALAFTAACGSSEEEVPGDAANAVATPTPATGTSAAPTPSSAPSVSPAAVPADWSTYSDPGGRFTLRYPPTWFQKDGALYSVNPNKSTGAPSRPRDAVVVEPGYYEALGSSGCGGALAVDPMTGLGTPRDGATATSLASIPAWQITRLPGDPMMEADLTRIEGISLIYKGYCLLLTAYFTQQDPDVDAFRKIASSFEIEF